MATVESLNTNLGLEGLLTYPITNQTSEEFQTQLERLNNYRKEILEQYLIPMQQELHARCYVKVNMDAGGNCEKALEVFREDAKKIDLLLLLKTLSRIFNHIDYILNILSFPLEIINKTSLADGLLNCKQEYRELLQYLLKITFVVEGEPPPVNYLGDKEIAISISHLIIGNIENIISCTVDGWIVSELVAKEIDENCELIPKEKHVIKSKNINTTEENSVFRKSWKFTMGERISAAGKNCPAQKKNCRRTGQNKGDVLVADQKLAVYFKCTLVTNDWTYIFWTCSRPFILVSHTSQKQKAYANILWDHQFAQPNRKGFEVCDEVPWNDMLQLLNSVFYLYVSRYLTNEEEKTLKTRLLGHSDSLEMVTWLMFNGKNVSTARKEFTFWEWFHEIMKILNLKTMKSIDSNAKKHYKGFKGNVIKIIENDEAEKLLEAATAPNKAFIIRFSHNLKGCIALSFCTPCGTIGSMIWNVKTDKDIPYLCKEIIQTTDVKYLYNTPLTKFHLFEKLASISQNLDSSTGYFRKMIGFFMGISSSTSSSTNEDNNLHGASNGESEDMDEDEVDEVTDDEAAAGLSRKLVCQKCGETLPFEADVSKSQLQEERMEMDEDGYDGYEEEISRSAGNQRNNISSASFNGPVYHQNGKNTPKYQEYLKILKEIEYYLGANNNASPENLKAINILRSAFDLECLKEFNDLLELS